MPYYRAPAERPRQPKRFVTSREIEDMAAEGRTEIVHLEDMVITDAARETAHDLGVRIVKPEARPVAAAAPRSAAPAPAALPAPAPAARTGAAPVAAPRPAAAGDPLVQALVQAVRASKG